MTDAIEQAREKMEQAKAFRSARRPYVTGEFVREGDRVYSRNPYDDRGIYGVVSVSWEIDPATGRTGSKRPAKRRMVVIDADDGKRYVRSRDDVRWAA